MKTVIISIVCFFALQAVSANDMIPKTVQQKFSGMYPHAQLISWEVLPEGLVATFRDKEGLKKAFYKDTGEWIETRARAGLAQLPQGLNAVLLANHKESEISFITKVYSPRGIRYRVETELPDRILLYLYDSEGRLLESSTLMFSASAARVIYGG